MVRTLYPASRPWMVIAAGQNTSRHRSRYDFAPFFVGTTTRNSPLVSKCSYPCNKNCFTTFLPALNGGLVMMV